MVSVFTGSQRNDGAGRVGALRVLANVVQALQHPADGAVSAAHQDLVVGDVTKHVQTEIQTIIYCISFKIDFFKAVALQDICVNNYLSLILLIL